MLSPKGIKAPESSEGILGRDSTGALRKPTTGGGGRSLQIPSPAWVSEPPASRTGLWRLPGTSTREVGLPGERTPERSLPEVLLHIAVCCAGRPGRRKTRRPWAGRQGAGGSLGAPGHWFSPGVCAAAAEGTALGRRRTWVAGKEPLRAATSMPVAVGPYGQSQPSCFHRVKMGFVMGCAMGMAAGALFGTFSCLRIGMRGRELMGGIGKTMMQSGHRGGHPVLIRAVVAHNMHPLPSVPSHVYYNKASL
ncbi:uncharacterized protein LOC122706440 [Cervus elaphus]|uniref:uncharacterized protein LOC122706440 n=1 Tax=Cervus elaphus TaxID=9860 RepID=UPI001CC310C2|nr:uncharacterized protein LOC122706440 [Cervus elaphus]